MIDFKEVELVGEQMDSTIVNMLETCIKLIKNEIITEHKEAKDFHVKDYIRLITKYLDEGKLVYLEVPKLKE